MLKGKKIVLGVTGSIAAYKAADIIRLCQQQGAEVKVVMTNAATAFITPLTLQALSGHPVAMALLDAEQESTMGHIALARWADLILIAPATADTLAKLRYGHADDWLSALCLATTAAVYFAPAMNHQMWENPATQDNINILQARGMIMLGPDYGEQACGETGAGRLLAPTLMVEILAAQQLPPQLQGKRVVVTAGPTQEPLDPVRYLTNHSSGKMGFALAQAAALAGAQVDLITGPVSLATPSGVTRHDVVTACEMSEAVAAITTMDIFIACAAVADYRPQQCHTQKIKKEPQPTTIVLTPNPDIIYQVATRDSRPFVVGFAAETEAVAEYAQQKRQAKKMDMIAANQVGKGLGFTVDENALSVYTASQCYQLEKALKPQIAIQLMRLIMEHYHEKSTD